MPLAFITVKTPDGSLVHLDVDLRTQVDEFRSILAPKCGVQRHRQRLVFAGRLLQDGRLGWLAARHRRAAVPRVPAVPWGYRGRDRRRITLACLAAGVAGASIGALAAIGVLRVWGPVRFSAEARGPVTSTGARLAEAAWLAAATAKADAEFARRRPGVPAPPGGELIPTSGGLLPGAGPPAAGGPLVGAAARPDAAGVALAAVGPVGPAAGAAAGPPPLAALPPAALAAPAAGVPACRWPQVPRPPSELLLALAGKGTAAPRLWRTARRRPTGPGWVLAEDVDSLPFGSIVQAGPITGIALAARAGRRAVVTLAGGISAVAFILEDWRRGDFSAKWHGSGGAWTLARAPGSGVPRSWLSVTEFAREVPDPQFALMPASSCLARGPDLATIDEVNVANLVGAERSVQQMQLIEHFLEERQRGQDSAQQRLPQEEISAFMGASSRPSSMVCPALLDAVGKELERASQLKKNARELREEAKAAPGAKAGGGKS
ncbi:unnamed protein product [Prorocentrum cordatum]|uniref:Ubiquitin-like domain-containing protein n=1 Tax=Prorocentrum cordatum TaxID=2364126 RepID=A0ABN9RNB6_9DINO|nr:unnamed protein product [Polarella glacialis]